VLVSRNNILNCFFSLENFTENMIFEMSICLWFNNKNVPST